MTTYAIGDVQGCYRTLRALLDAVDHDPRHDRLWFVGDLVNRGPASLDVLRYVSDLDGEVLSVLGNHDLHLLARAEGVSPPRSRDTLEQVLEAPDRDDLLAWLRACPLMVADGGWILVHAGLLPSWSTADARRWAREAESMLRGPGGKALLTRWAHGHGGDLWSEELDADERARATLNAMTRMRVCTAEGKMDLEFKGAPDAAGRGVYPWFFAPGRKTTDHHVLFGHWATLGLRLGEGFSALDSGCVWGRQLSALRLEDREVIQVECRDEPLAPR